MRAGKGFTHMAAPAEGVEKDLGVAVDLGATRLRVCVGDRRGKLLWRESRFMAVPESVEDYVKQVVDEVEEGMRRADPARVSGVGIASIGPLDLKRGGVVSPANLPYGFVPLVEPLRQATGKEVVLMNDANAAALGERSFGAGRNHENLVYVTISTGIGGGAIVDGHLLVGKDGNAAEIGHVVVDTAGRLTCGCGRPGHWEAYCSGKNIPRLAMLLAGEEARGDEARLERMLGLGHGPVDSASVLGAAVRGNRFGARVVEEMGRLNSLGVANVINMFDPSLITVGGGVALNNPELVLGPIRQLVPKNAINRVPEIVITPLGDDAGLLGALSLAFDN
jgi:glucokinase